MQQLRRFYENTLLTLDRRLGGGGEGDIYTVQQYPQFVAKIYKPDKLTSNTISKLKALIANCPKYSHAAHIQVPVAFPVDLLCDCQTLKIVGYLMPRVDDVYPTHQLFNLSDRRQILPSFTYRYLCRTAQNLAAAVHIIHKAGYVIGDINDRNILVSSQALVTIVDTDSFQVPDPASPKMVYTCPVGVGEFIPPELQGKGDFKNIPRKPEHDLFGLAVVIFKILMEGAHPFDGKFTGNGETPPKEERISSGHFPYGQKNVPYEPKPTAPPFDILPHSVQVLFHRCFENGHENPKQRPSAEVWKKTLAIAEMELTSCNANSQHFYSAHLKQCPWCERQQTVLGGQDPFPEPGRKSVSTSTSSVQVGSPPLPSPPASPPPTVYSPPPPPQNNPVPIYANPSGYHSTLTPAPPLTPRQRSQLTLTPRQRSQLKSQDPRVGAFLGCTITICLLAGAVIGIRSLFFKVSSTFLERIDTALGRIDTMYYKAAIPRNFKISNENENRSTFRTKDGRMRGVIIAIPKNSGMMLRDNQQSLLKSHTSDWATKKGIGLPDSTDRKSLVWGEVASDRSGNTYTEWSADFRYQDNGEEKTISFNGISYIKESNGSFCLALFATIDSIKSYQKRIEKIINQYECKKRYGIGIQMRTQNFQEGDRSFTRPVIMGAYVGSPASKVGIKKGDIILSINNVKMFSADDVALLSGRKQPGETLQIEVFRNGTKQTYQVEIEELRDPNYSVFK
jgi:serine/threonine protein kinase